MSEALLQSSSTILSEYQRRPHRPHDVAVTVLPFLFLASFSSSASKPLQAQATSTQKRRQPSSLLERSYPGVFAGSPTYPNVETRPSKAFGGPQDLSALRPPPLDFVEGPKTDERGNVTILQRIKYWWRQGRALNKFYNDGLKQARRNIQEAQNLNGLFGKCFRERETFLCITRYTTNMGMQPVVTRREFQLLIRACEDHLIINSFAFLVLIFGRWAPQLIPIIGKPVIPSTCQRREDQLKTLRALIKRFEEYNQSWDEYAETTASNSGADKLALNKAGREIANRRQLMWLYVIETSLLARLSRYTPFGLLQWAEFQILLNFPRSQRLQEYLTDTILILREGGFSKLTADDIYEYCVRYASPLFISLAKEQLIDGLDPINESMRKKLVPILDEQAKKMVDCDWRRLNPSLSYIAADYSRLYDPYNPDSVMFYRQKMGLRLG